MNERMSDVGIRGASAGLGAGKGCNPPGRPPHSPSGSQGLCLIHSPVPGFPAKCRTVVSGVGGKAETPAPLLLPCQRGHDLHAARLSPCLPGLGGGERAEASDWWAPVGRATPHCFPKALRALGVGAASLGVLTPPPALCLGKP